MVEAYGILDFTLKGMSLPPACYRHGDAFKGRRYQSPSGSVCINSKTELRHSRCCPSALLASTYWGANN